MFLLDFWSGFRVLEVGVEVCKDNGLGSRFDLIVSP